MTENDAMVTRQSELVRVLSSILAELPRPLWIALVDDDGLMVACVPEKPKVDSERIAAMTAVSMSTAKRVLGEVEGGTMRFLTFAGSQAQLLVIAVDQKRFLSIGLPPQVSAQGTFGPLSQWVPEIVKILNKRFS